MPDRLESEVLHKVRYINTLTFTYLYPSQPVDWLLWHRDQLQPHHLCCELNAVIRCLCIRYAAAPVWHLIQIFCPCYNFTQNIIASSVGGCDYRFHWNRFSICVKWKKCWCWRRSVGPSENVVASTTLKMYTLAYRWKKFCHFLPSKSGGSTYIRASQFAYGEVTDCQMDPQCQHTVS